MELDLTDKKIAHLIGPPFWFLALYNGISFTDKDLDYLNTIKRHPGYESVEKARRIDRLKCSSLDRANIKIIQIAFYDKFYNDPKCPSGIKNVLFVLLGKWKFEAENFCSGLLEFRYEYVKKWIDSITE